MNSQCVCHRTIDFRRVRWNQRLHNSIWCTVNATTHIQSLCNIWTQEGKWSKMDGCVRKQVHLEDPPCVFVSCVAARSRQANMASLWLPCHGLHRLKYVFNSQSNYQQPTLLYVTLLPLSFFLILSHSLYLWGTPSGFFSSSCLPILASFFSICFFSNF